MGKNNYMNLKLSIYSPEVQKLISYAVGYPTPEKMKKVTDGYADDKYKVFGLKKGGKIFSCIIVEIAGNSTAFIRRIAIVPEERGKGLGRQLIQKTIDDYDLKILEAETDDDAKVFYEKCGFTVTQVESPFPGTNRYACKLVIK